MRITGRIVAGDALMVLLVKLVLGRLVAPTLWVVLVRNGLTLTLRPLVLANICLYITGETIGYTRSMFSVKCSDSF